MSNQNVQKVAYSGAELIDRIAELRAALGRPSELRERAEELLNAVPGNCDVLAWSPEGYNVALVASVLAEQAGRAFVVHRASIVAPLAAPVRREPWAWLSAEEILGFGATRSWAAAWAAARGGAPLGRSTVELAVVQ
jgi:hypothetical protein